MLYDIYLNALPQGEEENKEVAMLIAKLAQENADYVLNRTFPVIICRYATAEEKDFYLDFAKKHNLDMVAKATKETVFESFDTEIKRNEQEDTHLLNKPTIKEKLLSGLEMLKQEEEHLESFSRGSEMIRSAILKRKEMLTSKFKPTSIYLSFLIWAVFTGALVLLSVAEWLMISGCTFIGLMGFSLIGDYWIYRKQLKEYFSEEGERSFWDTLINSNCEKNVAIHAVEDFVDTLDARKRLTVLPVAKRNIDAIESILDQIDVLSLNEILMLF